MTSGGQLGRFLTHRHLLTIFFIIIQFILFPTLSWAEKEKVLRIFTWQAYVKPHEVEAVNLILKEKGYEYTVRVIEPWAEGPDQMFQILRAEKADVSFLTLNYLGRHNGRIGTLLQPINFDSPRLSNVKDLMEDLLHIPMGLDSRSRPLYIPFGGGAYGIWANMDRLSSAELPHSVKDLWNTKWHGKLSLTQKQIEANIALVMLALDLPPFYFNHIVGDRKKLVKMLEPEGRIQLKTNRLYKQVGQFWDGYPDFNSDHLLIASYGIAASEANARGGNWKLLRLKEGNTVWLDTINFHRNLYGKKLEVAEIFANYFIGKEVQSRIVEGLGMVAVSRLADSNPLVDENPNFFKAEYFWPPYFTQAANAMQNMSDRAMKMREAQIH